MKVCVETICHLTGVSSQALKFRRNCIMRCSLRVGTGVICGLIVYLLCSCSAEAFRSTDADTSPSGKNYTILDEMSVYIRFKPSAMKSLQIVRSILPAAKVVDLSFDGSTSRPLFWIKLIHNGEIRLGFVDCIANTFTEATAPVPASSLNREDRRSVDDFLDLSYDFQDVIRVAENASSASVLSVGLARLSDRLVYSVVRVVADRDLTRLTIDALDPELFRH